MGNAGDQKNGVWKPGQDKKWGRRGGRLGAKKKKGCE